MSAVLPSPDSATLKPNSPWPLWSLPVNLEPCLLQVEPERVNTQAAPMRPLSLGPPTRAVLPLADTVTLDPKAAGPASSLERTSDACWTMGSTVNGYRAPASSTLNLTRGPRS